MSLSVALLRGINVGGKNLIDMTSLAECFRRAGYENVRTFLQSGNVMFTAHSKRGLELEQEIELMLQQQFEIPILTVVRSHDELAATIASAPQNHGSDKLRSEVFFLKHPLTAHEVLAQMPELRDGVDSVAPGPNAVYFSRVAAQATKTRITRFMSMPVFQQMTVRTWRTTTRMFELLNKS